MDGHIAVLCVHAHGNFIAVFFQHPGGKGKIRHRHAAQDAAAHAEGKICFNALGCVRNHLKAGGLFLLDCFNPNIQYIVESEKVQAVIAEYTTDDGRDVLIKQTMRYESTTQINRIEWHYFINGEFHSYEKIQNQR